MCSGRCDAAPRGELGEVQHFAARPLPDLLSAAEAIREDHGVGADRAHRGQQHEFADRLRDLDVLGVEPEGAGHAAASAVQMDRPRPHGLQKRHLPFVPKRDF